MPYDHTARLACSRTATPSYSARHSTLAISDWMVGVDPDSRTVEVGPWPDRTGWSDRYAFTTGACFFARSTLSDRLIGMLDDLDAVIAWGVAPLDAYREFAKVEWFRQIAAAGIAYADSHRAQPDPIAQLRPGTRARLTARHAYGDRSRALWRLTHELVEAGLSDSLALALLKPCVWNKFAGRRDEDAMLLRGIEKARAS